MYPTKQIAVAQMQIKLEQIKAVWFQAVTEARANPTKEQVLRAYAAQYSAMEGANELATLAIRTCGGQAMLKSLPLERIYRDSRGDRVAILSLNRPDYLVLLYACARLGAMLVPLNWRLAVAEQLFILSDASVKVLLLEQAFAEVSPTLERSLPDASIVGLDFAPARGSTFDALLARARGDGRDPNTDLTYPLLIVYTSGTTVRPKGAVLRQEALLRNRQMSQHMHGLASADHVLTVLPFFHVGGLNIQTTPALHHGASVTIHSRFTPDTTLTAIARDRPTLTVLVPAILRALTDP